MRESARLPVRFVFAFRPCGETRFGASATSCLLPAQAEISRFSIAPGADRLFTNSPRRANPEAALEIALGIAPISTSQTQRPTDAPTLARPKEQRDHMETLTHTPQIQPEFPSKTPSPRRRVPKKALVGVALLVAVGGGLGATRLLRPSEPARAPAPAQPIAPSVLTGLGRAGDLTITPEALELAEIRLTSAQPRTVAEKLQVTGVLEAGGDRTAKVTPRVAGKIVAVYAVAGDPVRAGQTLGLIESRELASAQAAHRSASGRVNLARAALVRARRLASLGVYSQPGLESARREIVAAQGEVNALVSEAAQARGEVAQARGARAAIEGEIAAAQSAVSAARAEVGRARSAVAGAQRAMSRAQSALAAARSEASEAESEIKAAQSAVKTQSAALLQAQSRARTAESRLKRAESLAGEGLVSGQDMEAARATRDEALADVDAARANVEQSQTKVETARAHRDSALAQVEAAKSEVEAEGAQVAAARTGVTSALAGVATAQARVSAERGRLRGADAAIRSAQAREGGVGERIATARGQVAISKRALARQAAVSRGGFETNKEIIEAEAGVQNAEIERESAREAVRLLGGTPGGGSTVPLLSPIAGRVQTRDASPGESVDTEHAAFTVVNLNLVWAQLAIPPRDLGAVRVGQTVSLSSETAPGRLFAGRVSDVGAGADEATRAVRVRVALANPDGALRPGGFVRGYVTTDVRRERVTVPLTALQEHTGKATVYVALGTPGAFEVRHVRLGAHGQGWREISTGLKAGERIANGGTFYLKSEALKSSLSDGCCATGESGSAESEGATA